MFDWLPGNSILIEDPAGGPVATVVYQSNLGTMVIPGPTTDCAGGATCAGATAAFLTAVAEFSVTFISPTTYTVNPGGTPFFGQPFMLRRTMIYGNHDLDAFKARLQISRPVNLP